MSPRERRVFLPLSCLLMAASLAPSLGFAQAAPAPAAAPAAPAASPAPVAAVAAVAAAVPLPGLN
ncbi:MAG: hypothetical protein RJA95_1033, partial [Verrucomicrobiota bacterium]